MSAMIHQVWAVQRAKPLLAQRQWSSCSTNLVIQWDKVTTVLSTSGRKKGRLGLCRKKLCALSMCRTDWYRFKMVPNPRRWWLEIMCDHWGTSHYSKIVKIIHAFGWIEQSWYWRIVQKMIRIQWYFKGEALSYMPLIWEIKLESQRNKISQGCPSWSFWL